MGFFRRGRTEKPVAAPDPTASAAHPTGVDAGPSWMSPEDWTARLIAYRHQGRSDADILRVVNHLQQRGPSKPRTKAEDAARARSAGVVARTEYMDPEIEARALAPNESGLPDARLQHERDRLLVVTPLGWVNPRSRTAYRAGLHSFRMAGTSYHLAAVKAGRFTPGTFVRLVREPNHVHDPNAIAIYAESARRVAGYVPKGQARRLALLMDSGNELVAITVRGSPAGTEGVAPQVLVCERHLYEHLTR
jgi:hypothetical protein